MPIKKELYKNMKENGISHVNAIQVIVDYKVFNSILEASKHLKRQNRVLSVLSQTDLPLFLI